MKKEAIPLSRAKLRELARKTREIANVSDDEPFPVVPFLEMVLNAFGYDFEILSDVEMPDNYAETIPSLKCFRIREDVYLNAIAGNPRDRFTIAHEIGHLFLHDDITVTYARNEKTIPAYKNPEWQANTYAAELLVPYSRLQGMSVEELSQKYSVSKKVAQIQTSYLPKIPA